LKQKERNNRDFLKDLEKARADTLSRIRKAEQDMEAVNREETEFWMMCNRFEDQLAQYQSANHAGKMRNTYFQSQLDSLRAKKNFTELFDIQCDQSIATINGLRLGSLPNEQVPVAEINAACGVCAQFLWVVSLKLDPQFQSFSYRVCPLGGQSIIQSMATNYELYDSREGSGRTGLFSMSFLWDSNFDKGLVIYLKCLREVGDLIIKKDPTVRFPHEIVESEVGGMSIRKNAKNDQYWTDAVKKMFENMKVILHVMDQRSDRS